MKRDDITISKPPQIYLQIHREDIFEFPKDVTKYRVVKINNPKSPNNGGYTPDSTTPKYQAQLKIGFWIFSKWVDVGPFRTDTLDESLDWIKKKTIEVKKDVEVVWEGSGYSNTCSPLSEGIKKGAGVNVVPIRPKPNTPPRPQLPW